MSDDTPEEPLAIVITEGPLQGVWIRDQPLDHKKTKRIMEMVVGNMMTRYQMIPNPQSPPVLSVADEDTWMSVQAALLFGMGSAVR